VKRKLLYNFQHAYVNVLSRQQSAFNRQVLNALAEIGDAQAVLSHAARVGADRPAAEGDALRRELADLRRRYARLARRLARLQAAARAPRPTPRPRTQETTP
jgi:hypothetical protein